MASQLSPYIGFKDTTREAMTYYREVFGGELELRTFDEYGMAEDPADADKIMHARLTAANGMIIMAADTPAQVIEPPAGSNISLLLEGEDERELRGYWDRLRNGGKVAVELAPQLWGDVFGMCIDMYGVTWMINITKDAEGSIAV